MPEFENNWELWFEHSDWLSEIFDLGFLVRLGITGWKSVSESEVSFSDTAFAKFFMFSLSWFRSMECTLIRSLIFWWVCYFVINEKSPFRGKNLDNFKKISSFNLIILIFNSVKFCYLIKYSVDILTWIFNAFEITGIALKAPPNDSSYKYFWWRYYQHSD